MNRITMLAMLIGLAVVAAPLMAAAQCIEVTPESWDYGDVKVGTVTSQVFTIYSCADSPLYVESTRIIDDPAGAFTITSAPATGSIPGRETREIEVTFVPPSAGAHAAFLFIEHDAPGFETYVNLHGVGIRGWRCFEAKLAP